jgi:integrase
MASIRKRRRARTTAWIVDYRDASGVRHWVTCATREQAEQVRAARIRETGQAHPSPANPRISFKEYAEAWLKRVEPDLARSSARGYAAVLRHHLIPAFGHLKVRALHLGHVKTCLAEKRAAGYSKNMLRLIRATLSVILGDAVEEGLLSLNPVAQLARRRRGHTTAVSVDRQWTIRPLSAAQVAAVLEAAAKVDRRLHPYLLTLARAGLRPSEGLALQWDDLAFKSRELRVERSLDASGHVVTTKTGRARVVDMSVGLAVALQRLRAERSTEALKGGAGRALRVGLLFRGGHTPRSLQRDQGLAPRPEAREAARRPSLRSPTHVRDRAARSGRADHLRRRPARTHEADYHAPVVRALAPAWRQALGRRARSGGFVRAW